MLRLRVVALVFSTFSTNGLGKAPSPPPWVTLNTSVSLRAIICAVDLGIVVGRFSGKVINGALRKVTKKLVPSLFWFLKGSAVRISLSWGIVRRKTGTSKPKAALRQPSILVFIYGGWRLWFRRSCCHSAYR